MNVGYSRGMHEKASQDAKAMAGMQFPEVDDMQMADYEQYAGLGAVTKPIAKGIKDFLKLDTIADQTPREQSGKGLVTPTEKKKADNFKENLHVMSEEFEGTPDSPQMSTDEMSDIIQRNEFIAYDENNKPSYMPRSDSQATYKLEQIEGDEDVDSAVQAMAKEFSSEIDEARRGVLGDDIAKGLAHDLSVSPEQLQRMLTSPDGSTANVEEVYAMRNLMDQSSRRLKTLSGKVADDTATPEERAQFDKAFMFHKDLLAKFMAYRAEAGRSLRAYGVNLGGGFNGPEEQQQMMDMAMAGYDAKKIANIISTSDDAKGINSAVNGLSGLRKGLDVLTTQFVYSILSGIQTQAVNILGGAVQLGQSVFDRYLTEGGTRMRILMGKNVDGLMAPGEAGIYRMSLQYSLQQSLGVAGKAFKTGENYGGVGKFQQFEDPFRPEYWGMDPNTPKAKMLTYYGNATGFMVRNVMGASDGFFKSMGENAQYMSMAYRKAWHDSNLMKSDGEIEPEEFAMEVQKRFEDYVQNPTIDMHIEAKQHGKEVTYQDATKFGNAWQKFAETIPVVKFFTPFVNTPVSIVKQHLVDRTPLSLVFNRGVIYSNTPEGQMARTKLGAGLGVAGLAYMLAEDGFLTGSRPTDPKEASLWDTQGVQPNSIVIPHSDGSKTYVSLARVENISYITSMVADLNTLMARKEIDWDVTGDTEYSEKALEVSALMLVSVMKSMEDKTFLQGLNTVMSLTAGRSDKATVKNVKRAGSNILVPTLIPLTGMMKDVGTWGFDENKKDMAELNDRFQATISWLKENAPDRLDIWGRPLKDSQRGNPVKITTADSDPVMEGLLAITEATGGKTPFGRVRRNLYGFDMTSDEYHDVSKYVRNDARDKQGRSFKQVVGMVLARLKDVNPLLASSEIQKVVRDWDSGFSMAYLENDEELMDKYMRAINVKYRKQGKIEGGQ